MKVRERAGVSVRSDAKSEPLRSKGCQKSTAYVVHKENQKIVREILLDIELVVRAAYGMEGGHTTRERPAGTHSQKVLSTKRISRVRRMTAPCGSIAFLSIRE